MVTISTETPCSSLFSRAAGRPNLDGIETTQLIREGSPDAEVLIVTNHESLEAARLSAQAGASGYVAKSQIPRDLVPMVKEVMRKHVA